MGYMNSGNYLTMGQTGGTYDSAVPKPPKPEEVKSEVAKPVETPPAEPPKAADATVYGPQLPVSQNAEASKSPPIASMKITPEEQPAPDDIDIIRNYDWTYSKNKYARSSEVPYIHAREFKLAGNSYITSLMTSALLFPDVVASNADAASQLFGQKINGAFKDNKFASFMSENASNLAGKIQDNAKSFGSWVKEQVQGLDNTANNWNIKDLKDNYALMYIRKATGRSYRFPHFDNTMINIGNNFDDSFNSDTAYQKMFENLSQTIEKAANLLNVASLTEPGMYIQRPKFYKFGDSTYSTSVDFYLFNTLNPNSYLHNLDLITKLVVQNTPHRFNRILVDPPCIYELKIPGRGFYPYAFISALQVDHVGTRRILKNAIGKEVVVPDAFKVHIEFKSLTSDVNNFIVPSMGTAGIDVSKRYGIGSILAGAPDSVMKQAAEGSKPVDASKPDSPTTDTPASPKAAAEKKEEPGLGTRIANFFSPSHTAREAMKK